MIVGSGRWTIFALCLLLHQKIIRASALGVAFVGRFLCPHCEGDRLLSNNILYFVVGDEEKGEEQQ